MGMTISILRLCSRRSMLSYQRRFPVVYLTLWVMRRPLLMNNQRRSTLFVCLYVSNTEKPAAES